MIIIVKKKIMQYFLILDKIFKIRDQEKPNPIESLNYFEKKNSNVLDLQ